MIPSLSQSICGRKFREILLVGFYPGGEPNETAPDHFSTKSDAFTKEAFCAIRNSTILVN